MAEGIVFDVQRFSVHDGPGIRTTVFLKGCPLKCRWCHNPEGLDSRIQWRYFAGKCSRCGRCATYTGVPPVSLAGKAAGEDAGRLTDVCCTNALAVSGKRYTPGEIVEMILRDRDFYGEQGGVTFSGGEATMWPEFLEETLHLCREQGIHTALDTCGYAPADVFRRIVPLCSLVLFDIKGMDPRKHFYYTGKSNALIHENFRSLAATGMPVWIRIPLIAGFTADAEELHAVIKFLEPFQPMIERVTLMPYHDFGNGKYQTLGYQPEVFPEVSEEAVEAYKQLFSESGFLVKD